MKIIFVRHGHPNYEKDCLTELGHLQAEAAAERLSGEKINSIYSSTCGRAVETAQHIAARHGLGVESYDFIRELHWGPIGEEPLYMNGNPWLNTERLAAEGKRIARADWAEQEPFCRSQVVESVRAVREAFDHWLAGFGCRREGDFYRLQATNEDTLVMVSHAGASSAVLSHLLNIPFPLFCVSLSPNFTGITVVEFCGEPGTLTVPRVRLLNDARHIEHLPAAAEIS